MSLFTLADVAALRTDRLVQVAQSYMPGITTSDTYLLEKLQAAEADAARRLRVFLEPTEMVPMGTPQEEIDALVAAGKRVEEEPGYDYDPDLFTGNTWGLIEVRQAPIIAVHSVAFYYPAPGTVLWQFPADWLRPDKKYGRISVVPIQAVVSLPLNAYIISSIGGGRTIPFMMGVRYTAGLKNARADYPDLIDVIKKAAVLMVIDDQFLPQSGSVSGDGLSQSISWDAEKYRDTVDKKLDALRQSIHGIRMMVM